MTSELQDGNGRWVADAVTVVPCGSCTGDAARHAMSSVLVQWSMEVWSTWRDTGVLPHGKGSLHERDITVWAIRTWEHARNVCEQWKMERKVR